MIFDPASYEILFGADVVEAMIKEHETSCRPGKYPGTYISADVCALQSRQRSRGLRGVELVEADIAPMGPHARWSTPQGWTVRADSHLDRKAVLTCRNDGTVDGSLDSAVEWARRWVAEDPANRYAWRRR